MSDTLTHDDLLLRLLEHGYGELHESARSRTLILIIEARQGEPLVALDARVRALERPGDERRVIARRGRIQFVHLIRRQDKAPT